MLLYTHFTSNIFVGLWKTTASFSNILKNNRHTARHFGCDYSSFSHGSTKDRCMTRKLWYLNNMFLKYAFFKLKNSRRISICITTEYDAQILLKSKWNMINDGMKGIMNSFWYFYETRNNVKRLRAYKREQIMTQALFLNKWFLVFSLYFFLLKWRQ